MGFHTILFGRADTTHFVCFGHEGQQQTCDQLACCAGLASAARVPQEKPSEIRSVEKGNLPDGMESLSDGSAGLRFSRDKRMLEVTALA